jgi:hypothetical protein
MKAEIEAVRCILGDANMPTYWNIFAAIEQARNEGHREGHAEGYCEGHRNGMNTAVEEMREAEDLYATAVEADHEEKCDADRQPSDAWLADMHGYYTGD